MTDSQVKILLIAATLVCLPLGVFGFTNPAGVAEFTRVPLPYVDLLTALSLMIGSLCALALSLGKKSKWDY